MGIIEDTAREAQRRQARRDAGKPIHLTPEELKEQEREADERLESEIQVECVREYRANGFTVYEGLKEKRKTRIDRGHPDLELFHERAKWHGYHEVKTPAGKLRPDQEDFRQSCLGTNVPHYVGGVEACREVIALVRAKLAGICEHRFIRPRIDLEKQTGVMLCAECDIVLPRYTIKVYVGGSVVALDAYYTPPVTEDINCEGR